MGQPAIDMTGQVFGRLTVLERAENTKRNKAQWLCQCSCGNKTIVSRTHLKRGQVKSCGCYRVDLGKLNKTHGMKGTRLYRIWSGMKDRCLNRNSKYWDRYGGRGITVCEEWKTFENFMEWAKQNGYSKKLTLDRIDNDGNYEPSNCRWATMKQQQNNRSNNLRYTFKGVTHTLSEWSDIIQKPDYATKTIIKNGKINNYLKNKGDVVNG
jgi:hypothetical protein